MQEETLAINAFDNEHLFLDQKDNVLRILLLEDTLSDAELVKLELRKLDIEKDILHVTSEKTFTESFESFKPHIILSDYALPQYTGMDALKFVRSRNSYVPFIICTGSVNEETAVACIKAGADDYILKDSLARLNSAMENALKSKRNLIEKERVMVELEQSEENFRALAENAPDHIFKIDQTGKILYVNRDTNGVKRKDVIGTQLQNYVDEKYASRMTAAMALSSSKDQTVSIEIEGDENDPTSEWYFCRMAPVNSENDISSLVVIASNVTEIKKAQLELKQLNDRLHQLSHHLQNVTDEEKKKIAIEIHDQLGQELTGHKLGLYWIKQQLTAEKKPTDFAEIIDKIDYLVDLNTQTIGTVRRIAHELRPVVLDDIGLIPALEWHVENYNNHHDTVCHLDINCQDQEFGREVSTAIYRIVQEALTNIDKHAEANNAWVMLELLDEHLTLSIKDDGKGFDKEAGLRSKSLGLFGMQERIKTWSGKFELNTTEKIGTEILITLHKGKLKE